MSLLDHTPTTEPAGAERIALAVYGIEAVATSLESERDRTFKLDATDGTTWIMKVSNSLDSYDILEAQALAAQLGADAGVPVQLVRPSLSGELIPSVDGHYVRLLDYLPGVLLSGVQPKSPELRRHLGATMGQLARALAGFDHPAAHREFYWDVAQATTVIVEGRPQITDPSRLALLDLVYASQIAPAMAGLSTLRHAVIHGDANDNNVVVDPGSRTSPAQRFNRVSGVLDFGDLVWSVVIADVAVAASYHLHDAADPIGVVAEVALGFHTEYPLQESELDLLWDLVTTRLAMSAVNAAVQSAQRPGDPYLTVDEDESWIALAKIAAIPSRWARYRLRDTCGYEAHPQSAHVRDHLAGASPSPLLGTAWAEQRVFPLDLSVGSDLLGAADIGVAPDEFGRLIRRDAGANSVAVGGYDEARLLYSTPEFASSDDPAEERRTIHLAVDVWTHADTALHAPLAGIVHRIAENTAHLDYGPLVILEHRTDRDVVFFSLYGHLSSATLTHVTEGQRVEAGDVIGFVGAPPSNGGWAPHVHVQVILDLLELDVDYPGVAKPTQRSFWLNLSPDPALLLGFEQQAQPHESRSVEATLADRRRLLGPNLSVSYSSPLHIVRGIGSYLFDDSGRSYLDCVNNVAHVGHAHPHVVNAGSRQMAVLNTNTRYLHESVLRYAERLTATLPEPLSVCFFVNSGSEANDLALRIIRAHTGKHDIICLEHGYHGHTQALIDVSPYKHAGKGGRGAPPWVHVAAMPDPYRGAYRGYGSEVARAYADDVARCVRDAEPDGVAGMIVESMVGCGGQVVLPEGYLVAAAEHVRAAGGLVIADEVQVGFGRVGPAFWGFATQGLIPDVVTMGKPAGNGHPLAAVVTTPEIAASFANGMEYFNTFGGNPVSAEIGLAVLDVIESERLAENAAAIGQRVLDGAKKLMEQHSLIGDARGLGLYLGVELVRDRATREPAAAEAIFVVERMRELGVLVSIDGPHNNVLKIKPPLVWGEVEADRLISTLDRVLRDPALK
ncbi:MAG: aminotransferase class III-fold pyridoxal phosphate-dependent enzyme [Actinomycetes bacterium]